MTQDVMELLAGMGYGIVKGVVKSVAPGSRDTFNYMDKRIKDVSGAATVAHCLGEPIGKVLVTVFLAL